MHGELWTGSYKGGLPGYPFPPFSKCNRSVLGLFSKFVYWFIAIDYTTNLSIELVSSPPQLYHDLSTNPVPPLQTPLTRSRLKSRQATQTARITANNGRSRHCPKVVASTNKFAFFSRFSCFRRHKNEIHGSIGLLYIYLCPFNYDTLASSITNALCLFSRTSMKFAHSKSDRYLAG